jgi:hypothetical protein
MPDRDEEGFTERVVFLDREREIEFYSVAQRHKRGQSTREWLIEGMIPRRSVVILSGWSSVGKTHILNDLMYSVAFGEPFAGYQVMRRAGSLMFAAEGQDDITPRWNVIDQAKMVPWKTQHAEPFDPGNLITWTEQVPKLDSPDAMRDYSAKIDRLNAQQRQICAANYPGLGLVAIDTMAAAAELSDDQHNAAGSNQKIFNVLHALAVKYDCAIIAVDHLGKDASRGTRGSSAKEASADVVLTVTGTVNDDGITSNTALTIKKLRGGVANKRITFGLQEVRMPLDETGRRQDGVVVKWDVASSKLRDGRGASNQNKRNPLLMRAIDQALLEAKPNETVMVPIGRSSYRAVEVGTVLAQFKLSHPATEEQGVQRGNTIRKAYNRAMKDSLLAGAIGQKQLADGRLMVWRTDYRHGDSSELSHPGE